MSISYNYMETRTYQYVIEMLYLAMTIYYPAFKMSYPDFKVTYPDIQIL